MTHVLYYQARKLLCYLTTHLSVRKKQSPRDVLRNFTKFTGKHLCQSLFFNKVAGLRNAALLKKRL